MHQFDIRLKTTNPDIANRLRRLLAVEAIGEDDGGRPHTTMLDVFDIDGCSSWNAQQTCNEPEILRTEIDRIVRAVHRWGFTDDISAVEIYALAAQLLHAVYLTDPDSEEPLGHDRAQELLDDLGLAENVDGTTAPRTWVIAQLNAVCGRLVEAWTATLHDRAAAVADADRVPMPGWETARDAYAAAERHWPTGLRQIHLMLSAAGHVPAAPSPHGERPTPTDEGR